MSKPVSVAEILRFCKQNQVFQTITNQTKLITAIQNRKAIYCGFDPSAASLHIGHFLPLYVLKQFHHWGCPVIIVLGGLTARIGDPSFRLHKRQIQSEAFWVTNTAKISAQLNQLLPFAKIVNNLNWYQNLTLPHFLQQTGKAFTINKMLEKESISRAYQKNGLFFDELSYLLLQAYDFYHLFTTEGCHIQLGGSDQFPNITMGLDLIAKLNPATPSPAVGITTPLVTINGQKISKTDPHFLTLDLKPATLYRYYHFFLNLPDQAVQQWASWLGLESKSKQTGSKLQADKIILASKIITLFFPAKLQTAWAKLLTLLAQTSFAVQQLPTLTAYFPTLRLTEPTKIAHLLNRPEFFSSASALKRAFQAKSIKVNDQVILDGNYWLRPENKQELTIIKAGKKILLVVCH